MTNDLRRRFFEHRTDVVKGFSRQYNLHYLLYFEILDTAEAAIAREKQLKNWHQDWKLELIKKANPNLKDLSNEL